MSQPDVTVLMPAFNAAKYIAEAAVSVLEQRGPSLRLVVIDDGSTDETVKIVDGLRDPRIELLRNERNTGYVPILNRVCPLVESPFLARMDADDISLPGRIEAQVQYLRDHPEIDVVGCAYQYFSSPRGSGPEREVIRLPATPAVLRWFVMFGCPVTPNAALARTGKLLAAGGLDPDFVPAEGYEFWCRTSDTLAVGNVPELLLLFRLHSESISHRRREVQERNAKRALQRLLSARLGREVRWELASTMHRPESPASADVRLEAIDLLLSMEREYLQKTPLSDSERTEVMAFTSLHVRKLTRAGVLQAPLAAPRYLLRWAGRDGLEIPGRILRYAAKRLRTLG
jgi:glycosyltransferase involved in cell wall biosynthesis